MSYYSNYCFVFNGSDESKVLTKIKETLPVTMLGEYHLERKGRFTKYVILNYPNARDAVDDMLWEFADQGISCNWAIWGESLTDVEEGCCSDGYDLPFVSIKMSFEVEGW